MKVMSSTSRVLLHHFYYSLFSFVFLISPPHLITAPHQHFAFLDSVTLFLNHTPSRNYRLHNLAPVAKCSTVNAKQMVHMNALLARVHKIEWIVSLLNSKQTLPPWLKTIRHFSFTDDRGGRGGNVKKAVEESDDFFLQPSDTSFNNDNGSQEGHNVQHCLSESTPSRLQRGQRPNQRPRFDGNRGRFDEVDRTNRSSRIDRGYRDRNIGETSRDGDQVGDSFLDKFKLDFDNKTRNPLGFEERKMSNSNQPASEPMPQDSDEIFKKMKETGLIPNAVAMLDGLCKDGNVQEALKLFGLMREKGTIPEIVIYTAVVEGYTKAHKADDAIRIFRKMQSNGISPNAFSYTVLIQGLYKCSRLQESFEFCTEMLEAGHSPNVTTFVGLVDGFCKEKGAEEAKGVIKTLTEKGFAIDEKAVRVFLDKKAPFSPSVWEAIFGKKAPQRPF